MPLSNKEALQSIHRYFYDLYNKLPDGSLADFSKPQEPFQVTGAELAAALAALPASKASPRTFHQLCSGKQLQQRLLAET